MYSYSINDFRTGQNINTPAKLKLWEFILKRTFGGLDCAQELFEKHTLTETWMSYPVNGMITYLDELTGGDYGKNHPQVARVAGTLATQFKKKFPQIHYLMSNTSILDREFNICPPKPKEIKVVPNKQSSSVSVNHSKVYAVLADLYSKNLSIEEIKFVAEKLLNP